MSTRLIWLLVSVLSTGGGSRKGDDTSPGVLRGRSKDPFGTDATNKQVLDDYSVTNISFPFCNLSLFVYTFASLLYVSLFVLCPIKGAILSGEMFILFLWYVS